MTITDRKLTKRELIIEVWESLDCESVGTSELEEIQRAVQSRFGSGAVDSPASIARLLTDEGAVLRHPEVIECDATWRERYGAGVIHLDALNFHGLAECWAWMDELEDLRLKLSTDSDQLALVRLREAVQQTRQDCMLVAASPAVGEVRRAEAGEMAEWLAVWLKQPEVFAVWLDLRRCAPDFVKRFPDAFS
jgi:hypothetical protein